MPEWPKPSTGAENRVKYRAGIRIDLAEIKGQMREIKDQLAALGYCFLVGDEGPHQRERGRE